MKSEDPTQPDKKKATEKDITLARRLRRKAKAIIEKHVPHLWDSSPRSLIARQLALTLEELDQAREVQRSLELGMLRVECELDTALMQPHGPSERMRVQSQLVSLQTKRQELSIQGHSRTNEVTQRLLELVNRYVYLTPLDDRD